MQVSRKCEYALRAMYELAKSHKNKPISVIKIANRQKIPYKFLEQIFGILRKKKLVKGIAGKKGGYILSRPANQITVAQILKVAEGNLKIIHCLDNTDSCEFINKCRFIGFWRELNSIMINFMSSMTLEDLTRGEKNE